VPPSISFFTFEARSVDCGSLRGFEEIWLWISSMDVLMKRMIGKFVG